MLQFVHICKLGKLHTITTPTSNLCTRVLFWAGLIENGERFAVQTIAKINLGQTTEMTAILRDISERARLVEELKVAATTDPLTGIANRRRFDELVNAEMQRCQRFGHTMSLLLIDIDHFKEVNDTFGHQQGDQAILSLVNRIGKQLREVDMLGRWGAGALGRRGVYRAAAGDLAGAGLGQRRADQASGGIGPPCAIRST